MYKVPWAKFTIFNTPKISVTPAATRNSSMPTISPLVVWVTTQAGVVRQAPSASRSIWRSDVVLLLLPLRLEFDDPAPVGGLDVDDERLLRRGLAPADGVADRGVVVAHGDGAVGAERRVDLHAGECGGQRLGVERVGLLDGLLVEMHRQRVLPRPVGRPLVPALEVGLAPFLVGGRIPEGIQIARRRLNAGRQALDGGQHGI